MAPLLPLLLCTSQTCCPRSSSECLISDDSFGEDVDESLYQVYIIITTKGEHYTQKRNSLGDLRAPINATKTSCRESSLRRCFPPPRGSVEMTASADRNPTRPVIHPPRHFTRNCLWHSRENCRQEHGRRLRPPPRLVRLPCPDQEGTKSQPFTLRFGHPERAVIGRVSTQH